MNYILDFRYSTATKWKIMPSKHFLSNLLVSWFQHDLKKTIKKKARQKLHTTLTI